MVSGTAVTTCRKARCYSMSLPVEAAINRSDYMYSSDSNLSGGLASSPAYRRRTDAPRVKRGQVSDRVSAFKQRAYHIPSMRRLTYRSSL